MAHTPLTRRELLRSAALAASCCPRPVPCPRCATPAGNTGAPTAPTAGAKSAANPLGIAEDKPFEVVIFDGGLGDAYFTDIHQPLFKTKYPKIEIKHSRPRRSPALQPRLAGGTPPEVIHNQGANAMDTGALVQDGQLFDLTTLLEAPSWDDPNVKVRDTILPSAIELGTYDGKYSVLTYTSGVWGIWYSKKQFEENGWQASPKKGGTSSWRCWRRSRSRASARPSPTRASTPSTSTRPSSRSPPRSAGSTC